MFFVKKLGIYIDLLIILVRLEMLIGKFLDVVVNGCFRFVLDCYFLV